MYFYDTSEKANKSFQIDLRINGDSDGTTWTIKYRFAPPRYQLEFYTGLVSSNELTWTERSLQEKIQFKLTNWKEFSEKSADWFEIERVMINSSGVQNFRRRFTIKPNGDLWSEKWIQPKDKEWEFSHRMELKKIR
jgi:hypothetical protein